MSDDVKRLLDEATPLPWGIDYESPKTIVAHDGTGAFVMRLGDARVFSYAVQMGKNVDLALYAVNALPDYEAAVDALVVLHDAAYEALDLTTDDGSHMADLEAARLDASAALRRLRGKVPA